MKTYYEWTLEELDEHEDIVDVNFWDTLDQCKSQLTELGSSLRLGVNKRVYDEYGEWGELVDRAYAYVDPATMALAATFEEDGCKVPKRFHTELTRYINA